MSMKREIWKGDGWIIETSGGDLVTQDDPSQLESVVGTEKKVFVGDLGRVCVIAIKYVRGYFGWYNMPGYLDCTAIHFNEDRDELERELDQCYGDTYDDGYEDDGGGSVLALI